MLEETRIVQSLDHHLPRAVNCVLTIAGSDTGAASGVQADLKSIAANGGYGLTVVTAVTAQSADAVTATLPIPTDMVAAQIDAVRGDFDIAAVKSGMLVDAERVAAVARVFRAWQPPNYVLDPVIVATSGHTLLSPEGVDAMMRELLPLAALVTPNVSEAERLAGASIASIADAHAAGEIILRHGCGAVLIKGGHLGASPGTDLLIHAGGTLTFDGDFIAEARPRGTGCTLSAAIATLLGRGYSLVEAVATAKDYVGQAIRHGAATDNRLLDHFHALRTA